MERSGHVLICCLALLGFWAAVSEVVLAQTSVVMVPGNAHVKGYGTGWECNLGYREVNAGCAAIMVPANAYPTNRPYGEGWECAQGYRQINGTCEAIVVPSHAYLNASGDRWECDRG
jgi:hypothetical protein